MVLFLQFRWPHTIHMSSKWFAKKKRWRNYHFRHRMARNTGWAYLPQSQWHTFFRRWHPGTWPIYFPCLWRGTNVSPMKTNPQHHGTTRAPLHRVMSDILRLPAAPGHPGANQSSGLKQRPRQTPLAEPSGITVYHLNQLDIWRESGDPVFICPASMVLCRV